MYAHSPLSRALPPFDPRSNLWLVLPAFCADFAFFATSCFVSAASIGVKGYLLGRKLRSRHRVGAKLERARRLSLCGSTSITAGVVVFEEKLEEIKMKKIKYLTFIAKVWPAALVDRILAISCSPAHSVLPRRFFTTSRWER